MGQQKSRWLSNLSGSDRALATQMKKKGCGAGHASQCFGNVGERGRLKPLQWLHVLS